MSGANLTNHFLIAMPSMADPNFSRTVTYMCEHSDDGAMGIVINRPTDLRLSELLDHLGCEGRAAGTADRPVYLGGPVQRERGFVLHRPDHRWDSSLQIADGVMVTTSRDILEAIADGIGPDSYLVALGYAGWGPGQLEEEMVDNAWLSGPAEPGIIFDRDVESRWRAAAALLGVDMSLISSQSGHA